MTLLLPEILDILKDIPTELRFREKLLKFNFPYFRLMLFYVFHPDVEFAITDLPEYRADTFPLGLSPSSLLSDIRLFYLFDVRKELPEKKRRELLVNLLEAVHHTEAELVGKILKRDLGIPMLTYDLVAETFPGLLPEKK